MAKTATKPQHKFMGKPAVAPKLPLHLLDFSNVKPREGRPFKWETPEEFLNQAQQYFNWSLDNGLPFTITGLALSLQTSRETLMNYEQKDEFFDAIKMCKQICENYAEMSMFSGQNPTGAIFALKNYGWKDKVDHEHDVTPEFKDAVQKANQLLPD